MAALVWIGMLGSIAAFFLIAGEDLLPPTPAWFKWLVAINWVTGVAILLSFFAVIAAIRICRRSDLRRITKLKFSLVGLSCVLLTWLAVHWNLIGPAHRL